MPQVLSENVCCPTLKTLDSEKVNSAGMSLAWRIGADARSEILDRTALLRPSAVANDGGLHLGRGQGLERITRNRAHTILQGVLEWQKRRV